MRSVGDARLYRAGVKQYMPAARAGNDARDQIGRSTSIGIVESERCTALYGVPTPDSLPQAGNTSPSTAWQIQTPPSAPANASLSVAGALNTGSDVNFYKYTTGASRNITGMGSPALNSG